MWISTPPVVDHTILLSFANVCSFVSCCKAMNQLHIDVESKLELLEDSLPLNYCIVSCALGLLRLNSKLGLLCLWADHNQVRNYEIATCQCLLTRHRRPGIQQYSHTRYTLYPMLNYAPVTVHYWPVCLLWITVIGVAHFLCLSSVNDICRTQIVTWCHGRCLCSCQLIPSWNAVPTVVVWSVGQLKQILLAQQLCSFWILGYGDKHG